MLRQAEILFVEKQLPFWRELTQAQQADVIAFSSSVKFQKEEMIHRSDEQCAGFLLVKRGQIRTFLLSEDGREVTLYRLFEKDACVLSASCVLDEIAFDVMIQAVTDTEAILLPLGLFHRLMEENLSVALFAYRMATERFSDVMWSMQQILFLRADQRLAVFLWDETAKTGTSSVAYTHEQIARYMGSAREVVSRVLKYFAEEGVVALSRGKIEILDREKLKSFL